MGILSGITITCFFTSYLTALVLEFLRLFTRAKIPFWSAVVFGAAGLFTHSVYIWSLVQKPQAAGAPLSDWYSWTLMAAWIVAAAYLGLTVRRSATAIGVFFLPLVLAMIGLAFRLKDSPPFSPDKALSMWRSVHGISLLLGTVSVSMGFAAGVMYLIQSSRLKKKLPPPRRGVRLPSLEWLQRFNREALWLSTGLLGIGLFSGVVLNINHDSADATATIAWTDPTILTSGLLFVWLAATAVFELVYKPARVGRKVAYLTLASFVFLSLVLATVLMSRHAAGESETAWRSAQQRQLTLHSHFAAREGWR